MSTPPGWFHAEGDPPGSLRYWDGTAWVGDAVAAPARRGRPRDPLADAGDLEVQLISRMAFTTLRNAGIAAAVLLIAFGLLGWEILLLLGLISAAMALKGLLNLFGVFGKAVLPGLELGLLCFAAFVVLDAGIWRWVFVGVGVFFGLSVFSRRASAF